MNVVISGATGGIGKSIAEKFASNKNNLILLGRNEQKLKNLSKKIRSKYDIKVTFFKCDIALKKTIQTTVNKIAEINESVHCLINAAGIFPYGPIINTTEKQYDECMDINLKFTYLLSLGLFKQIQKNGGGKIINIGSSSSYSGFKNSVLYCASKHALLGFSRSLHDEWKNQGVSVHCISPGTVNTKMAKVLKQDKSTFINTKEFADFVYDLSKYKENMLISEVQVVRRNIK